MANRVSVPVRQNENIRSSFSDDRFKDGLLLHYSTDNRDLVRQECLRPLWHIVGWRTRLSHRAEVYEAVVGVWSECLEGMLLDRGYEP